MYQKEYSDKENSKLHGSTMLSSTENSKLETKSSTLIWILKKGSLAIA